MKNPNRAKYNYISMFAGSVGQNLREKWAEMLILLRNAYVSFLYYSIRHHFIVYIMDLEYKGPPDPLRGDEIYKRVRDAARVCAAFFFSFIYCFPVTKVQT